MSELRYISRNLLQGSPDLPVESVASLNTSEIIHGGRYAALIEPRFRGVYEKTVNYLIKGLILDGLQAGTLSDVRQVFSTIFGTRSADYFVSPQTEPGLLVVLNISRLFIDEFEGNHDSAMHQYHIGLTSGVNSALSEAESPYRLTPVPEI
jgi:hypothetical protein